MAQPALISSPNWSATQSRIWALAWPIMLSNITVPLLGLVDTAILGHLDDAVHLGAVAVGSQLFILLFWSFSFLRMGTTALTARASGARLRGDDTNTVIRQLQYSLWLLMPLIVLVIVLGYFLWPLALPWMAEDADIRSGAMTYLSIRLWSTPAVLGQYVLLGWFIGLGKTRIPLILLTLSNLVNAALNYLFVFHFDMTVDGVALGTVIAEYSALILALWFARQHGWKAKSGGLGQRPSWQQLKPLLSINHHLFVRTLVLLSTFAFFTAQGAKQGELVLAANAVLISLLLLISNALDGFAHAAEVMVGQSHGAKQPKVLQQAIKLTGINILLMAILLTLVFIGLDDSLFLLLTDNPLLLPVLHEYRYFLFFLPLVGMAGYWLDGVFVGAGASADMRNAMIAAVVLVFYPLCWLLQDYQNWGLWWAFYAFTLARALFMANKFLTLYKAPEDLMQNS